MGTKVGEMRETLMDAIERVMSGKMVAHDAVAIAKLAAQVSLSLQVEANLRTASLLGARPPAFGALPIGDETPVVEEIK